MKERERKSKNKVYIAWTDRGGLPVSFLKIYRPKKFAGPEQRYWVEDRRHATVFAVEVADREVSSLKLRAIRVVPR